MVSVFFGHEDFFYLHSAYFRVIEQLGGKQLVMNHMHHEDQLVRYNALLCVQKLMVHNWYDPFYLFFMLRVRKTAFIIKSVCIRWVYEGYFIPCGQR